MQMNATATMNRRAAVARILDRRGDALVVASLGNPTYDTSAAGDDERNFYVWGAMGGACMVAFGLALAQPGRQVLAFVGDGEMMMGLGSLATIGVRAPSNLKIIVIDNEHYGETGMQASHTRHGVDLVGIAKAARFPKALAVADISEADDVRRMLHTERGPILIQARIRNEDVPRVLPSRDGHAIKLRFQQALAAGGPT